MKGDRTRISSSAVVHWGEKVIMWLRGQKFRSRPGHRCHDTWGNRAPCDLRLSKHYVTYILHPITTKISLFTKSRHFQWILFFVPLSCQWAQAHQRVSIFILSILARYVGGCASVWVKYRRKTRSILSTAQAEAALIQITSPSTFSWCVPSKTFPANAAAPLQPAAVCRLVQLSLASLQR